MSMTAEHVFHEGDRAIYHFGREDVEVEVIEERGPIGFRGRRLVRIRMPNPFATPMEFEIAEEDLQPIDHAG